MQASEHNAKHLIDFLGLEGVEPPKEKVRIGLISRRRKRFILNEYELVQLTQQMGYECVLLPLESMTMHEQIKVLRSLDVLVGIHGSALDNSIFLQKGSVILHLLPYSVEHRVAFPSLANELGVVYQEWQLKDPSRAVFHWDLLQEANKEKLQSMSKEQILKLGQVAADNRETLMFWINQVSLIKICLPIITIFFFKKGLVLCIYVFLYWLGYQNNT
jgi:hypothetical protein